MAVLLIHKNSGIEDKRPVNQLGKGEIGLNSHESGAFICIEDTAGNLQQVGGIKISEDAPGSPVKGTAWVQPSTSKFYIYNGSAWLTVSGSGGGGGGGGAVDQIIGGDAVDVSPSTGTGTVTVSIDPNTNKGVEISAGQIAAKIGAGLQFDADGKIASTGGNALAYKGVCDVTTSVVPGGPAAGDTYANTGDGNLSAEWLTAIDEVGPVDGDPGDLLIFNGTKWNLIPTGGGGGGGITNLSYTATEGGTPAAGGIVNSDTGTDADIPVVGYVDGGTAMAGLMLPGDKTKLDGITAGAEPNVDTDLGIANKTATTLDVTSSTGTDATVPAATSTDAGLMTSAQWSKLDAIVDPTQAYTAAATDGTLTLSPGGDTTTLPAATTTEAGLMTDADKVKLDDIVRMPTGGGTPPERVFYINEPQIDEDYTVPAAEPHGTFGPVTIAAGKTVTVDSGGTWTVVGGAGRSIDTAGFWSRDGGTGTLSPATSGDDLADIGTITAAGGKFKLYTNGSFEQDSGASFGGNVTVKDGSDTKVTVANDGNIIATRNVTAGDRVFNQATGAGGSILVGSTVDGFDYGGCYVQLDGNAREPLKSDRKAYLAQVGDTDVFTVDYTGGVRTAETITTGSMDFTSAYAYISRNGIGVMENSSTSKFTVLQNGDVDVEGHVDIKGSGRALLFSPNGVGIKSGGGCIIPCDENGNNASGVKDLGTSVNRWNRVYGTSARMGNFIIELDQDNDASYTTRTEEYEEHVKGPLGKIEKTVTKTREVTEYIGETLNVLDELQSLRKRATQQDAVIAQMVTALRSQGVQINTADLTEEGN